MSDTCKRRFPWLNRTVLGIGLASLFSDWSHEIATTMMPAFLGTMGVAAACMWPLRKRWKIHAVPNWWARNITAWPLAL